MNAQKSILVVEDDADDRDILQEMVHGLDPEVDITLVGNGLEALEYLGSTMEGAAQLPRLIVLDLNLPFLDGRGTFERIRSDAGLQQIPVIIFTSSLSPYDKAYFTQFGAEFISKPVDYKVMHQVAAHMISRCSSGDAA